jgi:hypothetical protein
VVVCKSERGSAMVESALTLVLICSVFYFGSRCISLGIARIWLERTVSASLSCELRSEKNCRKELVSKIQLLSWGKILQLRLTQKENLKHMKSTEARLQWCNSRETSPCPANQLIKIIQELSEDDLRVLHSSAFLF